jgi:hypothetical protein
LVEEDIPLVCSKRIENFSPSLTLHPEPSDRSLGPSIGYQSKVRVVDRYKVIGFISSGTYGRVYKAVGRNGQAGEFAIKKFKPGEQPSRRFLIW